MAVNKAKRTKAIGALRKEGMSAENAVRHLKYLDMDEPFGPQIEELREDFPTLFEPATDDAEDKSKPTEDAKPPTTMERKIAALRGENVQRQTFKRTATPRPSTASKAAQEAAAHLTKNTGKNLPPTQKWVAPVRDINAGLKPQTREPSTAAKQLADRLKGN